MIKELFTNIPVLVVTGVAAVTSGSAVSKIAAQYAPELATNNIAVREAKKVDTSSSDVSPALFVTGDTPVSGNINQQASASAQTAATVTAGQFTLATLALHNKPGDCYVAYKTVVYDVSTPPSWQSCTHH
jgi:cytochrome b involved in lipid metabolism